MLPRSLPAPASGRLDGPARRTGPPGRYTGVAIALRWLLAVAIEVSFGIGDQPHSPTRLALDYRVGAGNWSGTSMLANDVQVRLKLALAGVPAL